MSGVRGRSGRKTVLGRFIGHRLHTPGWPGARDPIGRVTPRGAPVRFEVKLAVDCSVPPPKVSPPEAAPASISDASSKAKGQPAAGATAHAPRAGDQLADRQGARPRSAANAARPRRRGDRIEMLIRSALPIWYRTRYEL